VLSRLPDIPLTTAKLVTGTSPLKISLSGMVVATLFFATERDIPVIVAVIGAQPEGTEVVARATISGLAVAVIAALVVLSHPPDVNDET
jgi:hypothetical protein